MATSRPSLGFLFRTEEGVIDQATWWRGMAIVGVPLALATAIWQWVAPYTHRTMTATSSLVDVRVLGAFVYLLLFSLGVLLAGISFYNLSAKRLRACGYPTGIAGLVPLLALLAGATHWIVPRSEDGVPMWAAWCMDGVLLAALVTTIWVLGLRKSNP